ncbi:Thiol:disulfide interchange protein DsbD precursor [Porphyromonas crevioricanis]|uniref:Thiol:disulfide interchange protein DsbD n=1 Tax=Porphyromonas crevioricanis TaxID=393921 RepID=A0A2X4PL90_9PORP|nr:cytochrome c-type biogenesis protein DsbD, protein-disulfide reductase [Porphyromonas crevioricanis JCM 13913]SQH73115.1 Thiol:disulfide interchange protein DsbD precursor [Porphyromonas crevioricanis]
MRFARKIVAAITTLVAVMCTSALMAQEYKWDIKLVDAPSAEKTIVFTATINPGWHIFGFNQKENGPNSLEIVYEKLNGAKLVGKPQPSRKPHEEFDKDFDMQVTYYEGTVSFKQKIQVTDPAKFLAEGYIRAQACTKDACNPPTSEEFKLDHKLLSSASVASAPVVAETPAEPEEEVTTAAADTTAQDSVSTAMSNAVTDSDLWKPVVAELKAYGDATLNQADSSLWFIFLSGFLYGFVALVTPCVWPMIPMTVSFFLKRSKTRSKAIKDAITYGLSIVCIYLLLGIVVTLIFDASVLNSMATNAVFNIIFFLLLVFFAISFFGAFELVLPSKWTNKLDAKADKTTGLLSIFFMAFTLTLVSFSCTGPIIGTLLVQVTAMGSIVGPAVGLLGFALSLALPFTLFAIFPNWLQSMPKSGGWLNSVKVVLAFLELALSLKFLSVADLAYGWHILDREVFVSLWIVIFAALGFYLMGKIKFPHDSDMKFVSVTRYFLATISFAFAVYMVPGLWGAPLKAISAFAPPLKTQDFNLYSGEVHAKFDDYESGMAYAAKQGMPVLVDFSGFGCVNCRKMENAVWIDPEVKGLLEDEYVLITLMVDDKTPLPETISVEENGKTVKLRTIGDKWSYLQRTKFGATSQPFYVPLDAKGMPLNLSRGYDEDIPAYIDFLRTGLKEFKKRK